MPQTGEKAQAKAANPIVIMATAFQHLRESTALGPLIEEQLALLFEKPILTGRALSEIRQAILGIELPGALLDWLSESVEPLLQAGHVEVNASPVEPVAPLSCYHCETGLSTLGDVAQAVRACWASLYSEATNYYGRGRFAPDTAVIVRAARPEGVALPASPAKESPRRFDSQLMPFEDVAAMYGLELGECAPGFMRLLLKKVWLERACRDLGLDTYRVFYLVYTAEEAAAHAADFLERTLLPLIRVDWGRGSTVVVRERVAEVLRSVHGLNLLSDGRHACVQIAEVVPAQYQGFASCTGDSVLIEAFPGGVHGTKDGAFVPSVYEVGPEGGSAARHIARFRVRGEFGLGKGDWRMLAAPAYELVLSDDVCRSIAQALRALTAVLGEVRVEWYAYDGKVYVKDVSLERGALWGVFSGKTLSNGHAEGLVFRIDGMQPFDAAALAHGLSLLDYAGGEGTALPGRPSRRRPRWYSGARRRDCRRGVPLDRSYPAHPLRARLRFQPGCAARPHADRAARTQRPGGCVS